MASSYDNDLRLNEMATGDQSGSWGTVTNTNLELISEALSFGTEGITTNANTHTTTIADGASDPGRSLYLKYTGTLDSTCTITIAPNTISKTWYIENGTSGSQSIIISQGSGANVTIKTGQTKIVYSDGAGSGAAMGEIGTLAVANLAVDTNATVSGNIVVSGTVDGVDLQTLNTAVTANTAKTGITSGQANAITANTAKTGITSGQANAITANTSKTTNATHSGEVTGSGALTIANNVVDEANLKVSNGPTNDYVLTAQSGNTGGLTWAAISAGRSYLSSANTGSGASSYTFSSIPAGVKEVTFWLNSVRSAGSYGIIIQLGTSGGLVTSGYKPNQSGTNQASNLSAPLVNAGVYDEGFGYSMETQTYHGFIAFTRISSSGNTWVMNGQIGSGSNSNLVYNRTLQGVGLKTLGGELTQVRFKTTNNTFTSGTIQMTSSQ